MGERDQRPTVIEEGGVRHPRVVDVVVGAMDRFQRQPRRRLEARDLGGGGAGGRGVGGGNGAAGEIDMRRWPRSCGRDIGVRRRGRPRRRRGEAGAGAGLANQRKQYHRDR